MPSPRPIRWIAVSAAIGLVAAYWWYRPTTTSTLPSAIVGTSPIVDPVQVDAQARHRPEPGHPEPPFSRDYVADAGAGLHPHRRRREEVDELLRTHAAQPSAGLLVRAARISEECNLVRATLGRRAAGIEGGERVPPPSTSQRDRTEVLQAECSGFGDQPIEPAQIDAWYLAAARAGDLEATARLLAQGKNPRAPDAPRAAFDALLAAGRPETFPDLGQGLRIWTGRSILEGREVPVSVHDAAWRLAGCAATACPGDAFLLAYNCAIGGLCTPSSIADYLWLGGLAEAEYRESSRLAGVIRVAVARRDYATLGLVPDSAESVSPPRP